MNEIAKRRADKMQDCREWTAIDALEDMVAQVKAGKMKVDQLAIHWFENLPEGGYKHHYCVAGVTFQQHIALLHVGLTRVVDDWVK